MNATRLILNVLGCLLVSLAAVNVASAQATRTWVSGVGNDANPCSRTAPCSTFAGAISKTAPGGEIDVLDPGGFGAVTITKSISIEAVGVVAGVLVSGTNGIVIAAGPTDFVVLRGLTIDGLGTGLNGIKLLSGGSLHVENTTINNFTQNGIHFNPSSVGHLFVKDTVLRNNDGGGIFVNPGAGSGATASIDNVRAERNGFGVQVTDPSLVTVNRSVAAGNIGSGFVAASGGGTAGLNIYNSVSTNNGSAAGTGGLQAQGPNATIVIQNVMVTNNHFGLNTSGGGAIDSFGNNYIAGNTTGDGLPNFTIMQH